MIKKERKLKPIYPLPRAKSNEEEKGPSLVPKSLKKRKVIILEKKCSIGAQGITQEEREF